MLANGRQQCKFDNNREDHEKLSTPNIKKSYPSSNASSTITKPSENCNDREKSTSSKGKKYLLLKSKSSELLEEVNVDCKFKIRERLSEIETSALKSSYNQIGLIRIVNDK